MLEDLPAIASTFGPDLDAHMRLIYWVCGVWLAATLAVIAYSLVAFRRRAGVRAAWLPADTMRGAAWVLWPVVLVLVCDLVIEWDSARVWAMIKEDAPEADVAVRVTAHQFAFEFTYAGHDGALGTPDDFTRDELHVPIDVNVRLDLESTDVLHAFFVPELRLKQDIVPGRRIPAWFRATRQGRYTIACVELCGVAHSYMQSSLTVEPAPDYERWLAGGPPAAVAMGGVR
jgi:cytochrome c oxidase subunit 2